MEAQKRRFDVSLLVSTELRYIKRESPVWMVTLNIDMLLKSRAGKNRSKAEKTETNEIINGEKKGCMIF